MACRKQNTKSSGCTAIPASEIEKLRKAEAAESRSPKRLRFGVNSQMPADDMMQNNLTAFEWVTRNKLCPNFWGRYLLGENALNKSEIEFLHDRGCKIALIHRTTESKKTEGDGKGLAKDILYAVHELAVPERTAVFLEIDEKETASKDCMREFAKALISAGFVPGFKTSTDAKFAFDREYSRGMQAAPDVFRECLIWATAPSLAEYDRTTTTHFIHPDEWMPYAPSGITRADIAVWQYGKDCHPIQNDKGKETAFNVDLVQNDRLIIDFMF